MHSSGIAFLNVAVLFLFKKVVQRPLSNEGVNTELYKISNILYMEIRLVGLYSQKVKNTLPLSLIISTYEIPLNY